MILRAISFIRLLLRYDISVLAVVPVGHFRYLQRHGLENVLDFSSCSELIVQIFQKLSDVVASVLDCLCLYVHFDYPEISEVADVARQYVRRQIVGHRLKTVQHIGLCQRSCVGNVRRKLVDGHRRERYRPQKKYVFIHHGRTYSHYF